MLTFLVFKIVEYHIFLIYNFSRLNIEESLYGRLFKKGEPQPT